jgi:glycosyltransferase involved in cell wall biosynthesis
VRVLIAAKHPPGGKLPIGGVQTWSATVGEELRRLGHEVTFWGPEWPLPDARFDAGILANVMHTRAAEPLCDRVVRFSHGIIPDEAGGPGYQATSEEVRDRWGCDGVIRQPLDLRFWTTGNRPRTLLVRHSYRRGLDYLPKLAAARGLSYAHLRGDTPEVVRDTLQRASVVVATGRAAVEAMACGAAVVIADDRPYQGPLLDPDPIGAMTRNYSGRGGFVPTREAMRQAIEAARGDLRAHVEAHHDVRRVTARILECS